MQKSQEYLRGRNREHHQQHQIHFTNGIRLFLLYYCITVMLRVSFQYHLNKPKPKQALHFSR